MTIITTADKSEFTPQYWENYNYLYGKFTKAEMAPVIAQAKGYSAEYVGQWSKKIMTHCLMREVPEAIARLKKGVTLVQDTEDESAGEAVAMVDERNPP